MKKFALTLVILTALTACGSDDGHTVCETRPWGESCVTFHRNVKSGTYIGGTARFDQDIADESFGFKRAEVYITWECGRDPKLQWMRLDGVPADEAEFDLSSHFASVDLANECVPE